MLFDDTPPLTDGEMDSTYYGPETDEHLARAIVRIRIEVKGRAKERADNVVLRKAAEAVVYQATAGGGGQSRAWLVRAGFKGPLSVLVRLLDGIEEPTDG